jgi:hypothetical protein
MVQPYIDGSVSFELIEEIRQKVSPEASRQSALIGIVRAWPTPCLLVRGELGVKGGIKGDHWGGAKGSQQ